MLLADGVQHFPRNGSRATIRSLKNGAILAAAPAHAVLSFCLAFRQTGKRRKKSGVAFISQKLTLFLNQCAVTAAIGGVKPIDFRPSDLLCGLLSRLPRRVFFTAFPGGFEVVVCAVGRPRKCKSQCNDYNVAHSVDSSVLPRRIYARNHLQKLRSQPRASPDVRFTPNSVRISAASSPLALIPPHATIL